MIKPKAFIVTMDVVDMYTRIDTTEGIRKITTLLHRHGLDPRMVDGIRKGLDITLFSNIVSSNGTLYRQINGTAMGTNVAPPYANLFMAFHELIWKKNPLFPKFYRRLLDDIFFIWENSYEELLDFIKMMRETTPSLDFTYEIDNLKGNFLDITIYKGANFYRRGILDTNLFRKPTNKYLYTNPTTFQPETYTYSWLHGENVRFIRIISNENHYKRARNHFRKLLNRRGYPNHIIDEYLSLDFKNRPRTFIRPICDTDEKRWLLIKNNPGRDILMKQLRHTMYKIKKHELFRCLPLLRFVVTKGVTIADLCNRNNKALLSNASVINHAPRGTNDVHTPTSVCASNSLVTPLQNGETSRRGRENGIG
jgi:hypothetical protein